MAKEKHFPNNPKKWVFWISNNLQHEDKIYNFVSCVLNSHFSHLHPLSDPLILENNEEVLKSKSNNNNKTIMDNIDTTDLGTS